MAYRLHFLIFHLNTSTDAPYLGLGCNVDVGSQRYDG